jgi:hypothetical protein
VFNKLKVCKSAPIDSLLKIINQFAEAISIKQSTSLKALIQRTGKAFEIKSGHKVSKTQFLIWLNIQFREFQIENPNQIIPFEFDICNGCQAGRTVVIFDEGRFPKQEFDALFKYTAWNIEVKNGFITEITFCNSTEKLRAHDDYAH